MGTLDNTIIVTGGAGFIGSCIVRTLNDVGIKNIVIVDNIVATEKWKNMRNKSYLEYVQRDKLWDKLQKEEYGQVGAIIHMGACSSTIETDFDYLWDNNVEYSKRLWKYCAEKQIPFIYASSAATYGAGEEGFDDAMDIDKLCPLNGYGYSKQAFDQWTLKQEAKPSQYVGLKFFNVYGPNEYCKGSMASMVYHGFRQIKECGEIRLFKSYHPDYEDGGQLRDFVYVKDVCDVIMYFLRNPQYSGIYNVGTGRSQSFAELATAVFEALELEANIVYIDMPEYLRTKYQYYTKAENMKLHQIRYDKEFRNVQQGVADYVKYHLDKEFSVY